MLGFEEKGKPEYSEKNLSVQSTERTNSTHIWRRVQKSSPGYIGGRLVLSPLPLLSKLLHDNSFLLRLYNVGEIFHGH